MEIALHTYKDVIFLTREQDQLIILWWRSIQGCKYRQISTHVCGLFMYHNSYKMYWYIKTCKWCICEINNHSALSMLEKFGLPLWFYVSYINIYLNTMYVCIHTCSEAAFFTGWQKLIHRLWGMMAACALREHNFRAVSSLQGKKNVAGKNKYFYKPAHSL